MNNQHSNDQNGNLITVIKGVYGRMEIVEYRHNLVTHIHSQPHFSFWISGGQAYTHVGTERIDYQTNLALGINSLVSHDLCLSNKNKPATFLQLYIDDHWLETFISQYMGSTVFKHLSIPVDYQMQLTCWKLVREFTSSRIRQNEKISDDVLKLIMLAVNSSIFTSAETLRPFMSHMLDRRLRAAIRHMRENLSAPTMIEDVAAVAGMSRSHFFELFQNQLGTSPCVFWNSLRAEEAVNRLISDKENMTSVALDLGFSSPGNFSRFFRDHVGVPPSTFRRVSYES
jgi:AraC-like DNA-binding protein